MNLIDFKTQSNDLSKIFIPKCYEIYINNAINSSHTLLTITEFINNTGFEVDVDTFDILFMNINDDENPIYITSKLLDWMGYSGLEKFRKKSFKELLIKNIATYEYKILTNTAYEEFLKKEKTKFDINNTLTENKELKCNTNILPPTLPKSATGTSARSIQHIILMPNAFKDICMMLDTSKRKYIRNYYIDLEKLIQAYFIYQSVFKNLCYKNEIEIIKNLSHIKLYTQNQNRIRLNEEIKNIGKIGYVYFIQESITKHIKIGYTYNVQKRLSELQVGNSQTLKILKIYESTKPYKLEQETHLKYKDFYIRGEWYRLTNIE